MTPNEELAGLERALPAIPRLPAAMSLRASWKRTEAHLKEARRELPVDPVPGHEIGSAADFQEFLDHNELELALDELEGMAYTNPSTARFWFSLRKAASEMQLEGHRDRYTRILESIQPLVEFTYDAGSRRLQFGSEELTGHPDPESRCEQCGQVRFYHNTFDAYFCAFCNRWMESVCNDPRCEYCKARPEAPLRARANKLVPRVPELPEPDPPQDNQTRT